MNAGQSRLSKAVVKRSRKIRISSGAWARSGAVETASNARLSSSAAARGMAFEPNDVMSDTLSHSRRCSETEALAFQVEALARDPQRLGDGVHPAVVFAQGGLDHLALDAGDGRHQLVVEIDGDFAAVGRWVTEDRQ